MTLGEWAFRVKRIPGSLNVFAPEIAKDLLSPDDEIVVYCSYDGCPASKYAYHLLTPSGYKRVRQ